MHSARMPEIHSWGWSIVLTADVDGRTTGTICCVQESQTTWLSIRRLPASNFHSTAILRSGNSDTTSVRLPFSSTTYARNQLVKPVHTAYTTEAFLRRRHRRQHRISNLHILQGVD